MHAVTDGDYTSLAIFSWTTLQSVIMQRGNMVGEEGGYRQEGEETQNL